MRISVTCTLLIALLAGSAAAQEARVRRVDKITMPTQVDSNSPAFWRGDKLSWFGSTGQVLLSEGDSLFGPFETRQPEVLAGSYPAPKWIEATWQDDDGTLWAWYHTEPLGMFEGSTMTAPKIGAMMSYDGGRTLRDMGIVMESGYPLDPTAQNGYFAGGHGDFSVILNRQRTFFYFFFDNYSGPAESQGVCLARMAFEDRFSPTARIFKYCNGSWTEAGILGQVTPIFPVNRSWQFKDPDAFWGPSVHWNTYLNCYVMLMNHAQGEPGWSQEGVYISFCYDLDRPETWTQPKKILDKSHFPGWYFFYPQVMGLEQRGIDTIAGQTARLFVSGVSRWEIDFYLTPPPEVQPSTEPEPLAPSTITPLPGDPLP